MKLNFKELNGTLTEPAGSVVSHQNRNIPSASPGGRRGELGGFRVIWHPCVQQLSQTISRCNNKSGPERTVRNPPPNSAVIPRRSVCFYPVKASRFPPLSPPNLLPALLFFPPFFPRVWMGTTSSLSRDKGAGLQRSVRRIDQSAVGMTAASCFEPISLRDQQTAVRLLVDSAKTAQLNLLRRRAAAFRPFLS